VQVGGARRLGGQHGGQQVRGGVDHRRGGADARGVQDGGEVRPDPGEDAGHLGPGTGVARQHVDPGSRLGQLGGQSRRAGGRGTGPAGQDEPRCTATGQPAGHVAADRAGTTGDQGTPAGRPRPGGVARLRRRSQPAPEDGGRADRHLVLAVAGQDRGQAGRALVVERGRQVDQATPPVGILQSDDPAETPDLGLGRADQRVLSPGGHRAPGEHPQARVDTGVLQGLGQGQRRGDAPADRRVAGQRGFVEAEQRHHPREGGRVRQRLIQKSVQPGPVGGAGRHLDHHDVGAAGGQGGRQVGAGRLGRGHASTAGAGRRRWAGRRWRPGAGPRAS
jgi:hypothetical protein